MPAAFGSHTGRSSRHSPRRLPGLPCRFATLPRILPLLLLLADIALSLLHTMQRPDRETEALFGLESAASAVVTSEGGAKSGTKLPIGLEQKHHWPGGLLPPLVYNSSMLLGSAENYVPHPKGAARAASPLPRRAQARLPASASSPLEERSRSAFSLSGLVLVLGPPEPNDSPCARPGV